jgi:hypothetical protein
VITGWVLAGGFLAVLGAWLATDGSGAERRWRNGKFDLARVFVREEAAYVRFHRRVGVASVLCGIALVAWGLIRPA